MEALRKSQQELLDALERRKSPLFDPTLLAVAQGLLAPTKSGGFGESLANVAQLVGPAQDVEEKRAMENARLRAELAKEQLLMSRQLKGEQMFQDIMKRGQPSPATVLTGPAAAVAAGVEPGMAPAGAKIAPAEVAPRESVFQPRFTEDEFLALMVNRPDLAEALRKGEDISLGRLKTELEATTTQPGYILNKLTGKVTPVIPPGQADVDIRFPEQMEGKAGQVFKGSVEDLMALRKARNEGNVAEINRIYNRLAYGVTAAPGTAAAEAPGARPERALSVSESEVNAARQKELAGEFAKSEAKATSQLLDAESYNRETAYTAARVIKNAADNPSLYGLLRDPGLGNALASFVRDRGEQGNYAITKENLEDFLRKANFDTTKVDMVNLSKMMSDLARMHYGMRKSYFSGTGQGAVSDREDAGIAKIVGTTSDPAQALIYTARLTGRRAQFDVDVTNALRKERGEKSKNYTLEDFKSTQKYKDLLTAYEDWLTKTFNLPPGVTPETSRTESRPGASTLNESAIDAEMRRRGMKK
jgi:hypothetical protein